VTMRVSYLELRNYRKFRDLRLQFPDGVIGILGLNGAGKTTIIEAIAWALFGNVEEVVRTSRESVRRRGAGRSDNVSVALEFDLDGVEYRLEREMGGRSLSMKALLRSRGEMIAEGDRAVKSKIQDLIGMDHKSFFTSVYARQKELNELQNFTPSERKKVVLRMLRIDGIDSVIQAVREHRRDAGERIKGAQKLLLDSDGDDRERLLQARLEELAVKLEGADAELKQAAETERLLAQKVDEAKRRRDGLKKDVDEYNSTAAELRAKKSVLVEQRASAQGLTRKISGTEMLLSRLPELEDTERRWQEATRTKETIESEKSRHDKSEHLRKDIGAIQVDLEVVRKDLTMLETAKSEEKEILSKIESAKADKIESEKRKELLAGRIAELTARISGRREALAKDLKRLADIESAGEEGACPTCERTLEDAYDLIVAKLKEATKETEASICEDEKGAEEVRSLMTALEGKAKALDRKTSHQEGRLAKARAAIAAITAREAELRRLEERLKARRLEVEELGDVRYSAEEHDAVKASIEKLRKDHDEFVKLKERQTQLAALKEELGALKGALTKNEEQERGLESRAHTLEPKKRLYDDSIKDFDESYDDLSAAKDISNGLRIELGRAKAESESAGKELAAVRKQKEVVKAEQARVDELGTLEETLVNFKDHLIGKIAPTLGEMTSEILNLMTEGKYDRIELDDDYQISVDDEGVLHPLGRFSGGEADLANLSLRLAISRIIADRASTSQMNFLILDEVFGSLDPTRKRSVMAALSGLSSQFRQVMLITHVEDIKDLMSTVIRVEELPDGTSTAKMVS
jgi:exonuclease SbcC